MTADAEGVSEARDAMGPMAALGAAGSAGSAIGATLGSLPGETLGDSGGGCAATGGASGGATGVAGAEIATNARGTCDAALCRCKAIGARARPMTIGAASVMPSKVRLRRE